MRTRIGRIVRGVFGDARFCGEGVWELRIDWGSGYRVYYARVGQQILLLLTGGDKHTQQADIQRAKEHWRDYQQRTKPQGKHSR